MRHKHGPVLTVSVSTPAQCCVCVFWGQRLPVIWSLCRPSLIGRMRHMVGAYYISSNCNHPDTSASTCAH